MDVLAVVHGTFALATAEEVEAVQERKDSCVAAISETHVTLVQSIVTNKYNKYY